TLYKYLTEDQKSPWWGAILGAPMQALGWVMSIGKEKKTEQPIDIFKPSAAQLAYIGSLKKLIKMETDKKTNVISIKVTMQDPLIAAVIADSLVAKLQLYMTDYRTSKARADLKNNEIMLLEAKDKYYKLDSAYATAQDRNRNLAMKSAQVMLERLSNEKDLAFSIYQQIATQVEMGRIKVQEDTPIATIIEPTSVSLSAASPNKKIIMIAFLFLGVFAAVGIITVKFIISNDKEKDNSQNVA
ncbi:MAG: chain-length determining protein, partial [Rikenellaceae bacterium]